MSYWRTHLPIWLFCFLFPVFGIPLSCTGFYKAHPVPAWSLFFLVTVGGSMNFALGFNSVFPRMTRFLRDPSYSFQQKAIFYLLPSITLLFLGSLIGFGNLLLLRLIFDFDC